MIITNQSSIVKIVDEHLIIQNTIDKLKTRMNKTKSKLMNILYYNIRKNLNI